ncbi:hypothetical protein Goari_003622 [Gossypium aridum]|uniref:Uncharacterized protein n=1 Tax=Gossypium aridum TaxID=34290 RepID=A0A7J8YC11_GOSAI|nr:hypothetical protein [Gossypium aridum]
MRRVKTYDNDQTLIVFNSSFSPNSHILPCERMPPRRRAKKANSSPVFPLISLKFVPIVHF